MIIDSFSGKYHVFSNFHPSVIVWEGFTCTTAEHAYQLSKTLDEVERALVSNLETPVQAKQAGKLVTKRSDWGSIKVGIMEDIVRLKFTTHPDLAAVLIETGDAVLIEGNYWRDTFWGVCNGVGRNELGKILMKIRTEINCGITY